MISYSASNVLLGRLSTAAPYWTAFVIDLLALAAAGGIAVGADRYAPKSEDQAAEAGLPEEMKR